MTLRKAELKDVPEIIEITKLLYLKIPNFVWDDKDFIEKHLKRDEYFLAEENEKIMGVMSLRQRQNGLGTQFIEFAKKFTKEKGFDTLHVYSFVEYDRANFYLRKGFKMLDYSGYYQNHKYYCFETKV